MAPPADIRQLAESLPPQARVDFLRSALQELLQPDEAILVAREALAHYLQDDERVHVPTLIRRGAPMTNTWTYQNEKMAWDIQPGEKVLDIGSGGWPFRLATHLLDRHLTETSHRSEALVRDERPLVIADVHQLPFADKSFDFVFCSHVLEHVESPGSAIREIMRVGKRGYLELPSRISDFLFNFTGLKNHHRWHALKLGNTLVMIEWPETERRDTGVSDFYRFLQSRYENSLQRLIEQNWDFFFAQLRWTETIGFLIIDNKGRVVDSSSGIGSLCNG